MSKRPDHRADDAFDRLRAADPAAGAAPDHAALHAAVRSRVGGELTGAHRDAAAGDELAAARATRRPSRWLAVAAVAAGTLAVGSAGYALGDRSGGGDLTASTPSTAAITLPQDAPAAPQAAGGRAGATAEGTTGGPATEADAARIMPWFGGRTVFTAQGLSDATGAAEAWAYDPAQVFGAETAAQVAASLGLTGEPRREWGAWVVGPQDGSAPSLQLHPDGTASLSYYDPTRDPFGCVAPVPEPDVLDDPDGGGSDSSAQRPGPDVPACTTPDLGTAPQGDAAVARAREVVAGAGADPDAFEYEVMDAGSPHAVYVTAHQVLGGQRTGLPWSMTLVGDRVQSLYGSLAPLVPLGSYDVVSENAAVERLSDPRFGSSGGPVMAAAEDQGAALRGLMVDPSGPVAGGEAPGEATDPPSAVTAGSSFAWPVSEVVLTSARLGLAQHTQPDGATVLLPAYELAADDGSTWSVVAVTDAALDFAAGR